MRLKVQLIESEVGYDSAKAKLNALNVEMDSLKRVADIAKDKVNTEKEVVKHNITAITKFRPTPDKKLSVSSVKAMLKNKGFYDKYKNASASGFSNDYKLQNNGEVFLIVQVGSCGSNLDQIAIFPAIMLRSM